MAGSISWFLHFIFKKTLPCNASTLASSVQFSVVCCHVYWGTVKSFCCVLMIKYRSLQTPRSNYFLRQKLLPISFFSLFTDKLRPLTADAGHSVTDLSPPKALALPSHCVAPWSWYWYQFIRHRSRIWPFGPTSLPCHLIVIDLSLSLNPILLPSPCNLDIEVEWTSS